MSMQIDDETSRGGRIELRLTTVKTLSENAMHAISGYAKDQACGMS